jgi:acetyl esterase/lipase
VGPLGRTVARARLILDLLVEHGRTFSYGPDRSQRVELHLPPERGSDPPHPVMVMIHGGAWQARFSKVVMRSLARDLSRRGWAVWNIEYRRVGDGGGWPATFADVAAAIDHLADVAHPALDLGDVSVLGHSAGGHLALWAASRANLPAGAPGELAEGEPVVPLRRVISIAGACDLADAYARKLRGGAPGLLMGGSPEEHPERYDAGDPIRLLPLGIPALLVHGTLDETVSVKLSRSYQQAALAAGDQVELVEIDGQAGRHRAHIDPRSAAWGIVTRWLGQERPLQTTRTPALDRASGRS